MAATVDSRQSLLPSSLAAPTDTACSSTAPLSPRTNSTPETALPTIPSDEDRSSEDGSHRSGSPRRAESNSSSISDPAADDEEETREQQQLEMDRTDDKDDGLVGRRSRSSTIKTNASHDNVRKLSASEMRRLANSPESLPVAAAPERRFVDPEIITGFFEQREAIRQSMLRHPELRQPESLQPNGVAMEARGVGSAREVQRRPSPAPRTLSTPPTGRKQPSDISTSSASSPRRYSFHPTARPPPLHLNVEGVSEHVPSLPSRNGPATAIPLQQTDSSGIQVPSPIPPIIPLPPMSLPTHLQLELAAQRPSPLYIHQSHAYDLPYESNAIKFERLKNVLLLPPYLERTLNFGAIACLDAWLYNFTILPVRFTLALAILVRWWAYVVGKEVMWLVGFVWYGLGRLWRRGRKGQNYAPSEASDGERSRSQSRSRAFSGGREGLPDNLAFPQNGKIDPRINGNGKGNGHVKSPLPGRTTRRSGTFRHKRTKSVPSALSAFHKADLLQGAVIICSSLCLMTLDASRMYHFIRAQSAIKLYVIYNILEVGDRLLSALGQDILECLFSTETLSRNASGRSKVLLPMGMFLLALGYCCLHSIALYYQVITLNVAVNSYSNALLTLLLSNQFVEIKSTVFKRFEKDNLFQLTCADIVERFQLWIMLFIIGMRNVVEVGGLSVPGAGSEPGFDEASGALPLHNPSILPHSFTVLPSWLMSGEVLSPFLIVIGSEMLVDTIKHAYVTKFNNIKPAFYTRILDILCKDYYTNAFMTPSLTRRLGLAVIPLSCLFIRASVQTYHMLLSTHLPMPIPESTQTSLSDASATPSSPAMIAALNRFDSLIRDSLGRATYGYPYGSPLNSRPWYSWTSDDFIAAITMIVVFFIAFLVLLILKLLLGMILLKYSRNRYAKMKHKEHLVSMGKLEREVYEAAGKRVGGFGHIEVGEDRQRWIHADPTEGLKGGKGPGIKRPEEKKKPESDYNGVFRYDMVAKRIW
ncbi:Fc.00g114930.m01.CDS01 [Cosmosporella sp. VM-42]